MSDERQANAGETPADHLRTTTVDEGRVSRRGLLRGTLGVGLGAAAAGVAAAGVSYADTSAVRHRAFAAKAEPQLPSSTRLLWRGDTEDKVLALTFDDGPDPQYTVPLLRTLTAEDVRATFFVVGERAVRHRDLLRRSWRGATSWATTRGRTPTWRC